MRTRQYIFNQSYDAIAALILRLDKNARRGIALTLDTIYSTVERNRETGEGNGETGERNRETNLPPNSHQT